MVAEKDLQSYGPVLERLAACPANEQLEQFVSALAAARLSAVSAAAPPPLVQLAEALGLWRLQRHPEAYALLQPLELPLQQDPRYWILRGMVSKAMPHGVAQALYAYRQALGLDESRADLHYNLANLLKESDPRAAEQAYRRSLSLDPGQAACWHNLGSLLHQQDRFLEALLALHHSLGLDPAAANVWCDLGNVLQALDRLPAAQRAFELAISLDRSHGASHVNLGAALVQGLQPEQAIVHLQRGVELEKSSADSLWNLSLAHLQLGNYREGWLLYDARLSISEYQPCERPTAGSMPASLAECPGPGQPPLVVWSEQGAGDAIQFCRYLGLLEAAGVPFEFRCRGALLRLMQTWTGLQDRAVLETPSMDPTDCRPHIPLLSLPRLFGTTMATIPSSLPYMRPPCHPPAYLQVPQPPGGLAVGLVWASHAGNRKMYGRKSIPLALLIPRLLDLVDLDLIDLHCIQCGKDEAQLQPWLDRPRIINWAPHLEDFADTAHVINQLDLVISVDTAVAHLAGALRKPTWLLLPHGADFRWLQHREDSPWYPASMRLFRQPAPGDWPGLIQKLHAALDALFLLDLGTLVDDSLDR